MKRTRLVTTLGIAAIVLALVAAVFNYLNNGRITVQAVMGVLFMVSVALGSRALVAGADRRGPGVKAPRHR